MNAHIQQIAERLRGLRDSLELSIDQAAEKCNVLPKDYANFESGNFDIPMSFLCAVAETFGVETTAIISGYDPHAESYFVSRKGTGVKVERFKAYQYFSLASGFRQASVKPFEVVVEPSESAIQQNTHLGQEFNYVIEGVLQIRIAGNDILLDEGDSIYFDASKPHGMKALGGRKARFIAVII